MWGSVRLSRPLAVAAFDQSDRDFMRSAAPRLTEGIRRGLVASTTCDVPSPAAPGLVVVDNLGQPAAMSANAQEWWLGLFPGDPSVNGEFPLPIRSVAFAALVGCTSARCSVSDSSTALGDATRRPD